MNFWVFRGLGKLIFLIFESSEVSESLFFSFLGLPRSQKVYFSHFRTIRGLGSLLFCYTGVRGELLRYDFGVS